MTAPDLHRMREPRGSEWHSSFIVPGPTLLQRHRIAQLDGVRAVAMLSVFVHHALNMRLLWMGVDLFFVLSGFLITGVLLDAREQRLGAYMSQFYGRRVRRILPPYLLALLVLSLFVGWSWLHHGWFYLMAMNLLIPLHIDQPSSFETFWSLAVEEQFYLLWPFAVFFLSRRRLAQLSVVLIVVAPVLRASIRFGTSFPILTLTPFRMDLLAAGALLCLVYRHRSTWIRRAGSQAGIALFFLGLFTLLALGHLGITTTGNSRAGNALVYESTLACALGVMVFALAGRWTGWLATTPVRYLGQISYSMYLIHYGVIVLLQGRIRGAEAFLVALVLTVAYAALSWEFIERPLLGRPRRIWLGLPLERRAAGSAARLG